MSKSPLTQTTTGYNANFVAGNLDAANLPEDVASGANLVAVAAKIKPEAIAVPVRKNGRLSPPIMSPGIGEQSQRTRSNSTVVETPYIHLEFDPVRKRKLLNTYEIIGDLGAGQHGKVKLALDTITEEKVAIKVLDRAGKSKMGTKFHQQEDVKLDDRQVQFLLDNEMKIRKEIAIMKKCNHENIVKLREVIDDHRLRKIYLVLEYLENGEIKWQKDSSDECSEFIGDPSIQPALCFTEARKVFKDVVLGLEYLHYQGIIHRDIKPANLLLSKTGTVKISDFGVSFSLTTMENNEYDLCKSAGTPAFYAPELCSIDDFNSRLITHKIDIWALGVTLYCLMFGCLPFYGINGFELFAKINKSEVMYPSFEKFICCDGNSNIDESSYNELLDLLNSLLIKNPLDRIDIPEIKAHPFVKSALVTEEDVYKFENNLLINFPSDFDLSSPLSRNSAEDCKIGVSQEEVGNAISGISISSKIKQGFNKVFSIGGKSSSGKSSSTSLKTRKSQNTLAFPAPATSPTLAHTHRLSISSVFSKKNGSRSSSAISSREHSRSNTIYTPSHIQSLSHEDSSSSLRSRYSTNSDSSFNNKNPKSKSDSLYLHGNFTGSSFISPSLVSTQIMAQSQDYFNQEAPDGKFYQDNSHSGSQLSFKGKLSQLGHNKNISTGSAQLSDASVEAGFCIHSKPVASSLGNLIEKSSKSELAHRDSPLNSPIFGLGSKSRNNSFLSGYNNGIAMPRKGSNVSLPVNSSYASLNSMDDDLLYSTSNTVERVVGYSTPSHNPTIQQNISGFLNNANSASGFLNPFGGEASAKFKFDKSIKEKIYGKKNKDLFKFDDYDMKSSMEKPSASSLRATPKIASKSTISTTQEDINYGSKAPSFSTINEVDSHGAVNSQTNYRQGGFTLMGDSSDSEDDESSDEEVIQFNVAKYRDRTRALFNGSSANSTEDDLSSNFKDLRPVDSIVTVPNSLISKLNSADNSVFPSQSQIVGPSSSSQKEPKSPSGPQFHLGGDESGSDDNCDNKSFIHPDLLRQKLMSTKHLMTDSGSSQLSSRSSGDESEQELTLNFHPKKQFEAEK